MWKGGEGGVASPHQVGFSFPNPSAGYLEVSAACADMTLFGISLGLSSQHMKGDCMANQA